MVYIGLDIGGTSLKAGIITGTGEIIEKKIIPWGRNRTGKTMVQMSLEYTELFIQRAEEKGYNIGGIGISATGQIDHLTGVVIGSAGHIPMWQGTELKEIFEKSTGLPVCVENDANCAVIAEHWVGEGLGCTNILMYTIGTGIGGGIIINNQLLRGATGIAGEIGHMTLAYNGVQCYCGMKGCFEKLASMSAFVESVRKVKDNHLLEGPDVFDYIEKNDLEVIKIYQEFLQIHGAAISSLIHLLNPQCVIIGGGISAQSKFLIQGISDIVHQIAMPAFTKNLEIKAAHFTNEAGMVGAVKNLIKENQK